jgi:hypothetical protein
MRRLGVIVILLCLAMFSRFLVGCGGGGGGGTSTNSALVGNLEGYAFLQGGTITLRNSPTAPAGSTSLAGATVTVDAFTGTTTTDAAGHFLLRDVPVGQKRLHVTPQPAGAAPLDIPVTVLGGATLQVGTFTVSRQQAVDAAKQALAAPDPTALRILAPQQPLPTGTLLEPALGNDSGQPDPALSYTSPSPQWLVYVDHAPDQRFQHPVSYVLVDAETGAATVRDASSWPRINGVSIYADDDKNAAAPDLVQVGTRKAEITRTAAAEIATVARSIGRDHVLGTTDPKTYALLIDGNSRSDMEADFNNVKASLFGPNGLSGAVEVKEWSPPLSGTVDARTEVKQLFNQICAQARPGDTILVYVTSHGSKLGGIYLQQGVESDESTTKDEVIYPFLDLDTSRCAACHVVFIIDTCYSGAAMVDMVAKSPPHAGQKLSMLVSSTSQETSGGITNRINAETGKTKGGLFTNAFLSSLKDFSQANGGAQQSNLQSIFDNAVQKMGSDRQHPQTVFRWDGQSCGAPPTLVSVTPEAVTATHTVGVTSCPQSLGTVTVKNLTDFSLSYTASINSSYFNVGSTSGTLPAGGSKSLGLDFNCGKVPPLSAQLSLSASYSGGSQTLTLPITLNKGP